MPRKPTTAPTTAERFPPLADDDIREQTDEGSYSRGRSYFRNGHILNPILRGDTIEARCIGSEPAPYRVTATLAPAGSGASPTTASCTCPRGGFCKHIVALLLTWIDDPSLFEELPPVADQLAGRSPEQLIAMIERMVDRYPDLQRLIDLPAPPGPGEPGKVAANAMIVDVSPVRRQIRSVLADWDPYGRGGWDAWDGWNEGGEIPKEITDIEVLAERYADAGQWANALAVLTALAEETLDLLPDLYENDGSIASIVMNADRGLADALAAQAELPQDQRLSADQREEVLRTIYAIWQADVFGSDGIDRSRYGVDALIRYATADERRTVEGWLRAELVDGRNAAAIIRFIVDLRRAGGASDEELLALCRDAGLWDDVASMLLSMDRIDEAIATAARHLRTPARLLAFADALIATGETHASRAIGLVDDLLWEVEGNNARQDDQLQTWLERQYAAHSREQDALRLARRRFDRTPGVYTYNEVERIARLPGLPGGTWDDVRPKLLLALESARAWTDLIQIHLAAGDGMAALDALDTLESTQRGPGRPASGWTGGWIGSELALRVAAAVERRAPTRAVTIYRRAAERAIAGRNRRSYQEAASHLAKVKAILEREGRRDEWKATIAALREEHKRLRALREELDNRELV